MFVIWGWEIDDDGCRINFCVVQTYLIVCGFVFLFFLHAAKHRTATQIRVHKYLLRLAPDEGVEKPVEERGITPGIGGCSQAEETFAPRKAREQLLRCVSACAGGGVVWWLW